MMQTIFNVLPIVQDVILALLLVRGIRIFRKRESGKKNHESIVALRQELLWTGFCGGGLLNIPVTIFGPDELQGGVGFLFEAMILLCIAMLLAYCNETIIYDDAKFTATNFVGMKRRFDYEEITAISRKTETRFSIPVAAGSELTRYLKEETRSSKKSMRFMKNTMGNISR